MPGIRAGLLIPFHASRMLPAVFGVRFPLLYILSPRFLTGCDCRHLRGHPPGLFPPASWPISGWTERQGPVQAVGPHKSRFPKRR